MLMFQQIGVSAAGYSLTLTGEVGCGFQLETSVGRVQCELCRCGAGACLQNWIKIYSVVPFERATVGNRWTKQSCRLLIF